MKRALALVLLAAAPAASAAEPTLTAAERGRAQALPHYATAGARASDGSVTYGNLVIAVYDDGRVRVEVSTADGVQAELALASPQLADGGLRSRFRAPEGEAARYANHGTLVVPGRGRMLAVLRSDLRMDADGLFAFDVTGRDDTGEAVELSVFGRAIGTCWADDRGTLKRVADLSKRPDCQRLLGGL